MNPMQRNLAVIAVIVVILVSVVTAIAIGILPYLSQTKTVVVKVERTGSTTAISGTVSIETLGRSGGSNTIVKSWSIPSYTRYAQFTTSMVVGGVVQVAMTISGDARTLFTSYIVGEKPPATASLTLDDGGTLTLLIYMV